MHRSPTRCRSMAETRGGPPRVLLPGRADRTERRWWRRLLGLDRAQRGAPTEKSTRSEPTSGEIGTLRSSRARPRKSEKPTPAPV